jgi:CBS domain-containing protein
MPTTGSISTILNGKNNTVWSISPGLTVFDAISLMAEKNVGALPVMDGDRLVGIFSERDYTRKVILHGKSSRNTLVSEILSTNVVTVSPTESLDDAMRKMTEFRIRHLPVVDEDHVVGIVSIGDLVKWIISAQNATIDHLEGYITGRYPA